jgi:hypothetical protein
LVYGYLENKIDAPRLKGPSQCLQRLLLTFRKFLALHTEGEFYDSDRAGKVEGIRYHIVNA